MFELRPYQSGIAEKVFDYMRKNKTKHPLLAFPTGSGKTVIMSDIIHKAITKWPGTRVLVLSHVKEILRQNHKAISSYTGEEVGLYSAGLKTRDKQPVTVAGIQTVYRRSDEFKDYNLIIIDECHLIPPRKDSMYHTFFDGLQNPRYIGLTATPYRLGYGTIYGQEDSIFDDLIIDYTSSDKFLKLIEDGYLCDLHCQGTSTELDVSSVGTKGYDFDKDEMSKKFNRYDITVKICKEIVKFGEGRKKWLIFAINIEHAESIAEILNSLGIITLVVHSKMDFDRDWVINSFKNGDIHAIVNVNVLTTGFDDPEIDLIALLRPTKSPVIHVQTIGRGLRISNNKDDCLVLDFAGNISRLGPINNIVVRKIRKNQDPDSVGEAPTKKCKQCDAILPIKATECPWCGYVFPVNDKLETKPSRKDVISRKKTVDWYDVTMTTYHRHRKVNSPDMVRVTYLCGTATFSEYVCINHSGYAAHKAKHWIKYRGGEANDVDSLLKEANFLKTPKRIKIDTGGKYPVIIDAAF